MSDEYINYNNCDKYYYYLSTYRKDSIINYINHYKEISFEEVDKYINKEQKILLQQTKQQQKSFNQIDSK
jgi:hypothetical protein